MSVNRHSRPIETLEKVVLHDHPCNCHITVEIDPEGTEHALITHELNPGQPWFRRWEDIKEFGEALVEMAEERGA
jgi:hypothetical protein